VLRPWGVLAVCAEPNWLPRNQEQERYLSETMERFGILESPFLFEYLNQLLQDAGFVDITRFHAANALIPVGAEDLPVSQFLSTRAEAETTLIARKAGSTRETTANANAPVSAEITVVDVERVTGSGVVRVTARLRNSGETAWLTRAQGNGLVTVVLRRAISPGTAVIEAPPRHPAARLVPRDDGVTVSLRSEVPAEHAGKAWYLDLINEG
jgi:hypothetical protein